MSTTFTKSLRGRRSRSSKKKNYMVRRGGVDNFFIESFDECPYGFVLPLHDGFEGRFRFGVTPRGCKVSGENPPQLPPIRDGPVGETFIPGHCSFS